MKRYKLGQRRTKPDTHGNSATMPDMIECENGEYIKYSEYEELLESIGVGGVSGQRIAQQPASGDHIPDASNMMEQDADPCKLEAAHAQRDAEDAKALDLLDTLFTAWENGVSCYEAPDDRAGCLGNAFRLDDDTFRSCVELLNRRRQRDAARKDTDK